MARKAHAPKQKLDKDLITALETVFTSGSTVADACSYTNISTRSYYHWMSVGEKIFYSVGDDEAKIAKLTPLKALQKDFFVRIKRAQASMRILALATIQSNIDKDWKAAAWLLERSDPANWGKRVVENTHEGTINVRVIRE